jgi:hypothetical protein
LEIVGSVKARGAIDSTLPQVGTGFLDVGDVLSVGVLGALKHHVLEQMSEPGAIWFFVLRSHVIPEIDMDNRKLRIVVENDLQAVI